MTLIQRIPIEVQFAQGLAGNEQKNRNKTFFLLKKFIRIRLPQLKEDLKEDEFITLWKGMHYQLWMQDKPLIQEKLIDDLCQLVHDFTSTKYALMFIKTFFDTEAREWFGLDQWRINKFMMFVREFLYNSLLFLKNCEWEEYVCKELSTILEESVMDCKNSNLPIGLKLHLADIFMIELRKVADDKLSSDTAVILLSPFLNILPTVKNDNIMKKLLSLLFEAGGGNDCLTDKNIPHSGSCGFVERDPTRVKRSKLKFNKDLLLEQLMEKGSRHKCPSKNRSQIYKLVKRIRYIGMHPQKPIKLVNERDIRAKDVEVTQREINAAVKRLKKYKENLLDKVPLRTEYKRNLVLEKKEQKKKKKANKSSTKVDINDADTEEEKDIDEDEVAEPVSDEVDEADSDEVADSDDVAEADSDSDDVAEADSDSDDVAEADSDSDDEADSDSDDVAEADSDSDDVAEADSDSDDVAEADSDSDDVAEADSDSDDVAEADSDSDDVAEADSDSDDVAEADSDDVAEADSDDVAEADSDDVAEADSDDVAEADSDDVAEADSDDVAEADSDEVAEADSDEVAEADSDEVAEADSDDDLDYDAEAAFLQMMAESEEEEEETAEDVDLLNDDNSLSDGHVNDRWPKSPMAKSKEPESSAGSPKAGSKRKNEETAGNKVNTTQSPKKKSKKEKGKKKKLENLVVSPAEKMADLPGDKKKGKKKHLLDDPFEDASAKSKVPTSSTATAMDKNLQKAGSKRKNEETVEGDEVQAPKNKNKKKQKKKKKKLNNVAEAVAVFEKVKSPLHDDKTLSKTKSGKTVSEKGFLFEMVDFDEKEDPNSGEIVLTEPESSEGEKSKLKKKANKKKAKKVKKTKITTKKEDKNKKTSELVHFPLPTNAKGCVDISDFETEDTLQLFKNLEKLKEKDQPSEKKVQKKGGKRSHVGRYFEKIKEEIGSIETETQSSNVVDQKSSSVDVEKDPEDKSKPSVAEVKVTSGEGEPGSVGVKEESESPKPKQSNSEELDRLYEQPPAFLRNAIAKAAKSRKKNKKNKQKTEDISYVIKTPEPSVSPGDKHVSFNMSQNKAFPGGKVTPQPSAFQPSKKPENGILKPSPSPIRISKTFSMDRKLSLLTKQSYPMHFF